MPQIYGPLTLPSGKVVKFRRPTGLDRMNVTQMVPLNPDNIISGGLMIDTYLQAKMITEVDGTSVDPTGYKNLFSTWDDADVQYYQAVYSEMFAMTQEKMDDAKAKAAFLLGNTTSTDGSSSASDALLPSGSASTTT